MTPFARRRFLQLAGAPVVATALDKLLFTGAARAANGGTLTIAYPGIPSAFDPNTGPQSVSPGIQSIYRTIYDAYYVQNPDLSLAPGVIEKFGWNADKTKISLTLRSGVKWHDGASVTMDDVVWNLKRLSDPEVGAPLSGIFKSNKNYTVDGDTVTFEVSPWRANMLERLSFLGSYLLPHEYFEKVGREGFEKAPIGSGPYRVDAYERGSFLRLKRFDDYWGGKPKYDTVVYKFTTDASSRVAEIERGSADATVDIPYEEYDRLRAKSGLSGACYPISDVALIFFNNVGPLSNDNIRKAAELAIDKKAIAERLHRGYATPLGTLLAPEYKGYDPSIGAAYDPAKAAALVAASGHSRDNPVEFTIQTTRGYKPKDYETVQAVVQMWRRAGIKANIEVYEIAKHFELRTQHKLAPAAFYNWGNATADPESSLGSAMLSKSPHSSWKGGEVDADLAALFVQKDEARRLEGYKALNRKISENAYILPLFQFYQPVIYKSDFEYTPHTAGFVTPKQFNRKA